MSYLNSFFKSGVISLNLSSEIYSKLSAEFIDTFWNKNDDDLREAAKGLF